MAAGGGRVVYGSRLRQSPKLASDISSFVDFVDFVDFLDFVDFVDFVGLVRVHRPLLCRLL